MNKNKRREHLQELVDERRTMIFYEAPHKLYATLCDMKAYFGGERKIALVREITKVYEEVIHTTLENAAVPYEEGARGEFVIIIEGAPEKQEESTLENAVALAREFMENGLSVADASKAAAKQTGFKKSEIYKQLI